MAIPLLSLSRPVKRTLALSVDALLCILCVWLALCLRRESLTAIHGEQWSAVAITIALALPLFVVTGQYRAIFRYSGAEALMSLMWACGAFAVTYVLVFSILGVHSVPRSLGILVPILLFMTVGLSRLVVRYWLGGMYVNALKRKERPQVVIYGAGNAGRQLVAALSSSQEMSVLAFLDDSETLQGSTLRGLTIYPPEWLKKNAAKLEITDVLLAMPSSTHTRRAEILKELLPLGLHVRTLPAMADLVNGRVRMQDLLEVDIEDLLGRDPVAPDANLMQRHIRQQVVLVTGAGGSIGSELCRQIILLRPLKLLLVEVSEYALYAIHQELEKINPSIQVVPLLASVRDVARMREIMRAWHPGTVYHAAAYKHVPMVEHNPVEGIRNNTMGTLTTARVAMECQVRQFVLVSTDKAVRPTNIMGASKRAAEMALQGLAQRDSGTRFSMVRFGNVLGSSGSVVPLFRKQIESGGPITLTHSDITRYFMTIPEAAQLVIQAGAMAEGGDVFVLDMGEPVRILDLAQRLVELSGRTVKDEDHPSGDIELKITGLRPGEKLYEELLISDNASPTLHPRVMKAVEDCPSWNDLLRLFQQLDSALEINDVGRIKTILKTMVPGYQPHPEVVDWIHLEISQRSIAVPINGGIPQHPAKATNVMDAS